MFVNFKSFIDNIKTKKININYGNKIKEEGGT